jgi:hypothetical protein
VNGYPPVPGALEGESIEIFREIAYAFRKPVILNLINKDLEVAQLELFEEATRMIVGLEEDNMEQKIVWYF